MRLGVELRWDSRRREKPEIDYETILALQRKFEEADEAWRCKVAQSELEMSILSMKAEMSARAMGDHLVNCMALAMNPNVSEAYFAERIQNPPALID